MSPCFSQIDQIDQIEQIDQTDQIDEIDQMNEINEIDEIEIAISQAFPCYSSRRKPDISLAKETLGWSPRLTIEEGLPKTIDYFDNLLRTSKGSSGFIAITHFFSALTFDLRWFNDSTTQ